MSDLLATVLGGVFIIAAACGLAWIRDEFTRDPLDERIDELDRLRRAEGRDWPDAA